MKKIIDAIKKMLGMSDKSSSDSSSQGFTLIELLIVIAVIGILAAALLVGIDPIDKINAGNDTKVINNIRQIYDGALRAYTNTGVIPANTTAIFNAGELKAIPVAPSGYGASNAYVYGTTTDDISVCQQVKSKAQRQKQNPGGAIAPTVRVFISGGQLCYTTSGCTGGATGYMSASAPPAGTVCSN